MVRPRARVQRAPTETAPAARSNIATVLRDHLRYRRLAERARRWKAPREVFPELVVERAVGYRKGANALAGSALGDNGLAGSVRGG